MTESVRLFPVSDIADAETRADINAEQERSQYREPNPSRDYGQRAVAQTVQTVEVSETAVAEQLDIFGAIAEAETSAPTEADTEISDAREFARQAAEALRLKTKAEGRQSTSAAELSETSSYGARVALSKMRSRGKL